MTDTSKIKHVQIIIQGKVQGVGFRMSSVSKASRLGITGIVRNEADGSVYIEAEGEKKQLDEFIDWCRQGPRLANVQNITLKTGRVVGYTTFNIEP
jgi:acylphosphatase